MAATGKQDKKRGLAREYRLIYIGDFVSGKIESPVFVNILTSTLAKLGGFSKFAELPKKTYKSAANLTHTYTRSDSGLVYRIQKGTANGVVYESTEVVTAPTGNNKLTLTLKSTTKSSGSLVKGSAAKSNTTFQTVTIKLPTGVNNSLIALWIRKNFGSSGKVQSYKYGKVKEVLYPKPYVEKSSGSRSGKSSKAPEMLIPLFVPVGIIKEGKVGSNGGVLKKGASSTITYATINASSAALLGFPKPIESTTSIIENGTQIGTGSNTVGASNSSFTNFKNPNIYTQIWADRSSKDDSKVKTPIAKPGTSLVAKVRFSSRKNKRAPLVTAVVGKTRIKTKNEYAYVYFPAGTPQGMIAEFLCQTINRGRSFQVGSGNSFGSTIPLPARASSGLR